MRRILVTGAGGQVGAELARLRWPATMQVVSMSKAELDITSSTQVAGTLEDVRPDVVVNAAAYTAVDGAEDEPDLAFLVNATGPELLAHETERHRIGLVHLSTDYVFDGEAGRPYVETDPTNPTGVYGASKLAGEESVLGVGGMVLRTSWVFGALGPNFVATMRRLAGERPMIGVVNDQYGCPTAALEIARAIAQILSAEPRPAGLYHLAAPDSASWWELAVAAIDGLVPRPVVEVQPINTAEYPTRAARPKDSRLNSDKIFERFGVRLKPWKEALMEVTAELNPTELNQAELDQHEMDVL